MNCKHEQITYAAGGYFCDRCGAMVTVDAQAGDALAAERMRDALGRVWRLADRGASNAQIIEAAAWGLGVNEKPERADEV